MTYEAADAIAGLLNGLMRDGWRAFRINLGEHYHAILVEEPRDRPVIASGTSIYSPTEAAEFIREHLG